ncbi:MAG: hypothetical protein HY867_14115 [Chloroflexi bacterium]|nr:hypothetical protein [Chloroflexota bacterium]
MNTKNQIHKLGFLSLLVLAMLVNILGQAIHEGGHLMVYQLMGRGPVWAFTSLIQLWDATPIHPDEWVETSWDGERGWLKLNSPVSSKTERVISTAAGPLAGLVGAVLGLAIARRGKGLPLKQLGLVLALNASLVAALYYLRSPLRTGGDEYEIAMQLGVARSAIDIPLGLAFTLCLFLALREFPSWRTRLKWFGTVLLGSVATGLLMVGADPFIIAQVDAGNPWFQPMLGYSFPVFLVNGMTLLWIWIWCYWQKKQQMPLEHHQIEEQSKSEELIQS